MIRSVDAAPALGPEAPGSLATVGRAALGADGVLLCERLDAGRLALLCSSGLSPAEERSLTEALAHRPPGPALGMAGFAQALIRDASVPGVGAVRLCAVQRHRAAFEGPRTADAIARHGAVAAGMRRQGGPAAGEPARIDAHELIERAVDWAALDRAVTLQVRRIVPAQRTGLLLWDEDEQVLRPVPGTFGLDPRVVLPAPAAADWASSAARVFASGEPYLTNRAVEDPDAGPDYRESFAVRRLIAVPIEASGRRVGVLQAVNKESAFTLTDVQRLADVAPVVANAAEVVALRMRLRRSERLEALFTSTAVAIASGQAVHEHLQAGLEDLRVALAGTVVALVAPDAEPIVCRSAEGRDRLEPGFLAQARTATGFRAFDAPARRAGEPGWSATHVPVSVDDAVVATLAILRVGGGPLEARERAALSRMAQLIALAWATESYQRGLASAARRAERRRIADELHDQVAQLLFAARLSLDVVAEALADPVPAEIPRARELLLRADAATRAIMDRNIDPDESRVSDVLARVITEVEEEYGRPAGLEVALAADEAAAGLSPAARQLVARTAREALVNAAKHAGPCQISVRLALTRRHRLLLTVTDAGVGLGPRRAEGYGTAALRRAVRRHGGTLRVTAASPIGGTRVAVSLPA